MTEKDRMTFCDIHGPVATVLKDPVLLVYACAECETPEAVEVPAPTFN